MSNGLKIFVVIGVVLVTFWLNQDWRSYSPDQVHEVETFSPDYRQSLSYTYNTQGADAELSSEREAHDYRAYMAYRGYRDSLGTASVWNGLVVFMAIGWFCSARASRKAQAQQRYAARIRNRTA